jgi:hypothetical protein
MVDPFLSVDLLLEDDIQRPRVRVRGEIDMLTVDSLRTRLADIIDTIAPGSTLTIDAARISFLSVDGSARSSTSPATSTPQDPNSCWTRYPPPPS